MFELRERDIQREKQSNIKQKIEREKNVSPSKIKLKFLEIFKYQDFLSACHLT